MTNIAQPPVYFLLVDDLEENLISLEALLRREGLVMLKARSGPAALEILLTHDVALALVDVQMPGMNGFELAELMRGTERTKRVPIIFVTAGTDDRQRRFQGYEAGAVDFLQKPIETDILRSKADVFFELYLQSQKIAQQRDELKAYAQALQDADRRKDEFLATLAHELRNPLAPIRNGLQILRRLSDPDAAEETRKMMDRQLKHMVRLIDDLLDVSRVSNGKIELRREYITAQTAIQTAIESALPLIEANNHMLSINIPDESLWLHADLTRISQMVTNLLNNAAKYTPAGGTITINVREDGEELVIEIADNGLGIRTDMLPKVFELFTQVDRNLERSQGGLGIGLALVRSLVEMHDGSISAESEGLGKGSKFKIRLPISAQPIHMSAASNEDKPAAATEEGAPLRILIVDDNVPSAQTTGWMMELIGHETTLAHDGPGALTRAKDFRPDVIFLDIGLPGMNGYDVCRALREDAAFKDLIVIAQTGWGQDRDREEAFEAGFDHHLVKPISLEQYSELLAHIKPARAVE